MSAQRYHPPDQRYAPSEDTRFPPRERSPPRYGSDRFPANNSYRPGYQNRSDDPRDSSASSLNRDVPRGPKASFDAPRGSTPFAPAAPRGRGFPGRGEYRGSSRASDAPRDSRDPAPAWGEDRDRSWRDRDLDRRDRRPSSPGRTRPAEFRDFREPQPPLPASREPEFGRRGSLRDQPPSAATAYESRRETFPSRGRGYLSRGRGRGDWDARSRERDTPVDERPRQSRSRSPTRDYRSDREIPRNRESLETREERRLDGREDRSVDRADRDRTFEKYNRERSPYRNESRRPSLSSTAPSSPRPLSPAVGQSSLNPGRLFNEPNRNPSSLRRASNHSLSTDRWDDRREGFNSESQDSKDRQDSRTSSPPPAIQVPAFGWNVWKAPTEPKAMKQLTEPKPMKQSVPANAPTGPKLAPPTGPKVDRSVEDPTVLDRRLGTRPDTRDQAIQPPRTPANVHPQKLNRLQGQAGIASPPTSPTFLPPSGPRTSTVSASPHILGANIPTGPKVDRSQQQPPAWAPTAPAPGPVRQWQRAGSLGHPGKPGGVVPAKREFSGEERRHDPLDQSAHPGTKPNGSLNNASRDVDDNSSRQPISPTWGEVFEPSTVGAGSMIATSLFRQNGQHIEHVADQDVSETLMELDDDDFEKKELRFQREKARLESELVDLSSPRLRGSHILEQLARLSCISLSTLPTRNARQEPPTTNEPAVFGTGQLLTPKAETISQHGLAVRKHFAPAEPPPISSYEIQSLPFLNQGPPTPLEELDIYKQNAERYRQVGPDFENLLKEQFAAKQERERFREETYRELYRPWISHVEQIDKESKDETPIEEEPEPSPAIPLVEPSAIQASTTEGRRRGGVSEYDIERVLQESLETANRENARRMKQELSAKIDHDKEAHENTQKDWDVRDQHDFIDKSRQIAPAQSISCWNFEPPADVVTPQDHELMVKHFRDYPKKWGKIALSIFNDGGAQLTYKDCINHYYATKWNQEYKERRDKRRQRGQKGSRLRVAQGRPKANALISNLGDLRADLYDGDDFNGGNMAVTDSGRPRRAAAPTFGEKEAEEQMQPATTAARRGPKGNDSNNSNSEKPIVRRSRGSTKERGGRKPRAQPSMRTHSTSPEKMDIDNAKRALMDARYANGTPKSDFEGAGTAAGMVSGMAPQSSGASRIGETSALSLDGASMTTSQQPRSGPSSYWSVQEVGAFPAYLAHYGTDWHSIAQKMDTKTGTMVKNYYFRLISNNQRPDLEETVRNADEKRQRGEHVGPIDPPAISTKKRGEASHQSAPRPLAPNAETVDVKDGSSPYHATAATQQIQTEPRARQSYSPVPQRSSLHGLSKPSAEIGVNGSEQNLMQARRNEQSSRQPHVSSHQGPSSQSSRTASDYGGQARPGHPPNVPHLQGRHFPDGPLSASQQPLSSSTSRYYQASPQHRFAQIARDIGGQRPSHPETQGFEERQYSHAMDPPIHRPPFPGQLSQQRTSPPARYGDVRRSQPPSPVKEQIRSYPTSSQPSQPASQAPPAARTEPRKMSNLAAILNPDTETRRPSNVASHNQIVHPRTASPPASQYPPRPSSHPDRGRQYTEPERSMTYPASSFPQQTPAPSRPFSGTGSREHQSSAQDLGRQDWQTPPPFASLTGSNQQGHRTHILDRPGVSSSMDYHRTSLQAFSSRPGPSPPPILGFSHPPSHTQQQVHQSSSHSSHTQPPNSYSQSAAHTPPAIQQNQQSYTRNSNLSYPPQQGLSQRQPAIENLSNRSESEYNSLKQDPLAPPKDSQISRERDSQTRSNLRPDSFLMLGSGNYRQSGNPFKQPTQPRQSELERGHQYGPVQGEQKKPLSPRMSQVHPGRGQDQPPPGRN